MKSLAAILMLATVLLGADSAPKKRKAYARISFVNQTKVVWKHNLEDSDPQITCRDAEGKKVETFDGWKVLDKNTVSIEYSKPQTAHCTARRTPEDE